MGAVLQDAHQLLTVTAQPAVGMEFVMLERAAQTARRIADALGERYAAVGFAALLHAVRIHNVTTVTPAQRIAAQI